MKFKKEFVNAIINNKVVNASQWQIEVQRMHSNHTFIANLLEKEETLSLEIADRCRDLQEQLIHTLSQFVIDLDDQTVTSNSNCQALLDGHVRRMIELNECIYRFLNPLNSAS